MQRLYIVCFKNIILSQDTIAGSAEYNIPHHHAHHAQNKFHCV